MNLKPIIMRFVYLVKSGLLSRGIYHFSSPRAFTSLQGAKHELAQILKVNSGENVLYGTPNESLEEVQNVTYIGEGGSYKGMIVIEKYELRPF